MYGPNVCEVHTLAMLKDCTIKGGRQMTYTVIWYARLSWAGLQAQDMASRAMRATRDHNRLWGAREK